MATKKKTSSKKSAKKRGAAKSRKKPVINKSTILAQAKRVKKMSLNATRGLPKKKRTAKAKKIRAVKVTKKQTVKSLKTAIKKLKYELALVKKTKNWVNAMPDELIRQDGSIALQESRLRHLGNATNEMRKFLAKNAKKGKLEWAADRVSQIMQVPLREVYTLWYSP